MLKGYHHPKMTEQPLVSVIVTAYQQPAYLNKALRSVESQTYRPLEIIVVDDGSGSEFTNQYELPPSAKLIVHEKRGGAAAVTRNTGIREARGEFIALLDQDDLWLPDKLAWQIATLQNDPSIILTFCHYQCVDAGSKLIDEPVPPTVEADVLRQLIGRNIIQCPSLVLLRREMLDRIGLFDERIRGTSDWDLYLRAAAAGPIHLDRRTMAFYRRHDQQWSGDRLMSLNGAVRMMQKTSGWIGGVRPDLKKLVHRAWAKQLRELAREQLDSADEQAQAMKNICRAFWTLRDERDTWNLLARAARSRFMGKQ